MSGLCTSGEATATVKSSDTTGPTGQYVNRELGRGQPRPPSFTDNLIEEARKRQAAQLLTKSNRRDALANNPGGTPAVSYSLLK